VTVVQELAKPGDLAVIGLDRRNVIHVFIAQAGSGFEAKLTWLFDIGDVESPQGRFHTWRTEDRDRPIELTSLQVLEEIGIEPEGEPLVVKDLLSGLIEHFGYSFPTTRNFSAYARRQLPEVTALDSPDQALMAWMEQEEVLFRTLEAHFVGRRIDEGFKTVDNFVEYSLSVHQRRKARAGLALENHLEELLRVFAIDFDRGAVTEGHSRPDFLLPGQAAYQCGDFPDSALSMLAVKSTCKDRWRQVLVEANRVREKHLLTLEPGVSKNQTNEMRANHLALVVPAPVHTTFQMSQRSDLLSVMDFLEIAHARQLIAEKAGFRRDH
jgi:hypothetical protein